MDEINFASPLARAQQRIAEIERELAVTQAALEQEYEASRAKDERIADLERQVADWEAHDCPLHGMPPLI